jgi:hypothetical protein
MRRIHDKPAYGWLGIVVLVAVADVTGKRTLSEAFRDASRHRVLGPVVLITWTTLTAHLFGLIPSRYDPFHRIGCPRSCSHG